jgi:AraC-like DNA-binding protein
MPIRDNQMRPSDQNMTADEVLSFPNVDPVHFADINPFVRYIHFFEIDEDNQYVKVKAYDYRLFYITEGQGKVEVNQTRQQAHPDTLVIWQPGVEYSFIPDPQHPFKIYGINFDYTHRHQELHRPIAPDKATHFNSRKIIEQIFLIDLPSMNQPVKLDRMNQFKQVFIAMAKEYLEQKKFFREKISIDFHSLLVDIGRILTTTLSYSDQINQKANEIISFIRNHYQQNLTNQDLGRIFNFHPSYISRLIRRVTGMPLHHYQISYRVNVALNLLQTQRTTVSAVASQVGFNDLNYFSRCFKKHLGVSPRRYLADFLPGKPVLAEVRSDGSLQISIIE